MKKIIIRSLLITIILGLVSSAIVLSSLPIISQWEIDKGYSSLTGLQALQVSPYEFGEVVAVSSIMHFIAFCVPIFLGCLWLGFWNRKDIKA